MFFLYKEGHLDTYILLSVSLPWVRGSVSPLQGLGQDRGSVRPSVPGWVGGRLEGGRLAKVWRVTGSGSGSSKSRS